MAGGTGSIPVSPIILINHLQDPAQAGFLLGIHWGVHLSLYKGQSRQHLEHWRPCDPVIGRLASDAEFSMILLEKVRLISRIVNEARCGIS